MINFFRKIRKKLADDNQLFKYTRYAIGEIVLVVIGILIALQINNWNENRLTKATVNRYLISLVQELKEDQKLLQLVKEYHSLRIHSLLYLLKYSGYPSFSLGVQGALVPFETSELWHDPIPEAYNLKFIDLAFHIAGRYFPMHISNSSIHELKNTGMFSNIQNQHLKMAIDDYYSHIEWEFFDEVHNESISRWNNSLLDEGVFYLQIVELSNPLELIAKRPERAAYLKNIIAEANYRANLAGNYSKKIDALITKIEQERMQR